MANNKTKLVRFALKLLGYDVRDLGLVKRIETADVRDLIRKLRPMDCGIDLIRVGGQKDGGYLIPDDLEGIGYCFSPGVYKVSDFENAMADRGIKSFMADYSVDGPAITRPEFTFDKKFLSSYERGKYITLSSWKDRYIREYDGDLILQMDIEGSEYEVLLTAPDQLLDQFRIMVIEFHYLDRLFDPLCFPLFSSCFERLLQYFYVAHIHPNNFSGSVKVDDVEIPEVMEFTLINKRRVLSAKPRLEFPHPLDVENKASVPALPLPKCWYC